MRGILREKTAAFALRHAVRIPDSAVLIRVQFMVCFRALLRAMFSSSVVFQFSFRQIVLNHSEVDLLRATVDETKLQAEFPALM